MRQIAAMLIGFVMVFTLTKCDNRVDQGETGNNITPHATVSTSAPTKAPATKPGAMPTVQPTAASFPASTAATIAVPTVAPTVAPTTAPTTKPTTAPTTKPTTTAPTIAFTLPVTVPTTAPTVPEAVPTVPETVPTEPATAPTESATTPNTAPTEPVQYYIYTDNYGNSVEVPEGTDVFEYTLSRAELPQATSRYPAIEAEIFRLTNIEREKAGLAPLALEEGAYYFASKRAYEASVQWSHTRPNGEPYYHIFSEYKVICGSGENLHCITYLGDAEYYDTPEGLERATQMAITGWMNSPGHRANILDEDWSSMAVGVYYNTELEKFVSVQLFFG